MAKLFRARQHPLQETADFRIWVSTHVIVLIPHLKVREKVEQRDNNPERRGIRDVSRNESQPRRCVDVRVDDISTPKNALDHVFLLRQTRNVDGSFLHGRGHGTSGCSRIHAGQCIPIQRQRENGGYHRRRPLAGGFAESAVGLVLARRSNGRRCFGPAIEGVDPRAHCIADLDQRAAAQTHFPDRRV